MRTVIPVMRTVTRTHVPVTRTTPVDGGASPGHIPSIPLLLLSVTLSFLVAVHPGGFGPARRRSGEGGRCAVQAVPLLG